MNIPGAPEAALPWTGERYLPEVGGAIELEHQHRYVLAARLVAGRRVLDIASGEGYGSDRLAQAARSVIGVDIAADAVAHARARYPRANLEFRLGSAADIPVDSASVDVVVSFETIEHHDRHERMLEEIRRVLVPGGLLMISSPNRRYYSVEAGYSNPYHVKELFSDEFEALLRGRFAHVALFGQRVVFGSLVIPRAPGVFSSLAGEVAETGLSRPSYDLALASDGTLPELPASLFELPVEGEDAATALVRRVEQLAGQLGERDERAARGERATGERDARLASLKQGLREREKRLTSYERALAERERRIAVLEAERERLAASLAARDAESKALEQTLAQIGGSRTWRVTAPLRRLNALRADPRALARLADRLPGVRSHRLRAAAAKLRASGLFDPEHYLRAHPDVRAAGHDPALHYLVQGWKELRDPSAAFSTAQYLLDHPEVARTGTNPLAHYLERGRNEGLRISPSSASRRAAAKLARAGIGASAGLQVRPAAAIDEEVRVIRASGRFDEAYYRAMYVDVPRDADPVRHYCEHGWQAGLNPSDQFDTRFYLQTYSDIREAGMNPFYHYVLAGRGEQRYASARQVGRYEDDIWFGDEESDVRILAFHGRPDWHALRAQRALFKGHASLSPPHDDLGFYESCNAAVLVRQAEMARRHGLHGFCFPLEIDPANGQLVGPVASFVAHPAIDFRFCMRLSADACAPAALHSTARALAGVAADSRYVRIADRPLVVVMADDDGAALVGRLRDALARIGMARLFVVLQADPSQPHAGDAGLDLPRTPVPGETGDFAPRDRDGVDVVPYGVVASQGVRRARRLREVAPGFYPVVTLGRGLARTDGRPLAYAGFDLRHYRRWLDEAIDVVRTSQDWERRFVFVDAWNDWNGGVALEPDRLGGYGRLNETTRALRGLPSERPTPKVSVIVPDCVDAALLRARLESIYRQSYRNIEVLVLDDGAAGPGRYVIEEYEALHPEVTRVLPCPAPREGRFARWAEGLREARGDLVWIAESDTNCDRGFLEVMVDRFADESVLLASARTVLVDRQGRRVDDDADRLRALRPAPDRRNEDYVDTAHNEVRNALGIANTLPTASAVLFRRPVELPLLEDASWRALQRDGDWILYLHLLRGGSVAHTAGAVSFFRRRSEAVLFNERHCREWSAANRVAAALYDLPRDVLEKSRRACLAQCSGDGASAAALERAYDSAAVERAARERMPNIMVSTMGFYPGGAEILPIRLANELKRRGLAVTFYSAGLNAREDGVRRMLRNDIPVVESADPEDLRATIAAHGIECLNSHQWFVQRFPVELPDVFAALGAHVASLHGMIEHGNAFRVTARELRLADAGVTTWAYTAQKNLAPFVEAGLYDPGSPRFLKIPNGMEPPRVVPVPRADLGIPEDAFVLCCVSRAIPDKGWAETILAVARARALTGRDIRLVLVGNGPVYDDLCRTGTPDFVYLAGFNEDSVGHYAAADMGVMLTKFKSESFPLTIVDCLFAGKPYIASDVGDIRNILTTADGVAGALVALEDWEIPVEGAAATIAAFAADPARYAAARAQVEAAARRYRIDSVADEYVRLFAESRDRDPLGPAIVPAEPLQAVP